jgi:molybdopterin converting factor small subunit
VVEDTVATPVGARVTVRYFAAAADAAGRLDETLPAVETVGELRGQLIEKYGDPMARVLASGSFLVDGVVSRDDSRTLGLRVDVLPPFAGG